MFPPLVRALVLGMADAGLFQPLWSNRLLDEWRIAVVRKHGLSVEAAVVAAQDAMLQRFPDAQVPVDPALEAQISLPDPADAHVLAAAVSGRAEVLLTFNLRDFPKRALAEFGVEATHPDGFSWQLFSVQENVVRSVAHEVLESNGIEVDRRRAVLKRAKLSRFAKALEV